MKHLWGNFNLCMYHMIILHCLDFSIVAFPTISSLCLSWWFFLEVYLVSIRIDRLQQKCYDTFVICNFPGKSYHILWISVILLQRHEALGALNLSIRCGTFQYWWTYDILILCLKKKKELRVYKDPISEDISYTLFFCFFFFTLSNCGEDGSSLYLWTESKSDKVNKSIHIYRYNLCVFVRMY